MPETVIAARTIEYYGRPERECPGCRGTKHYLDKNEIDYVYTALDQDHDALAFVKSLGYTAAPVIVIREGDKIIDHWAGLKIDKIRALKELQPVS